MDFNAANINSTAGTAATPASRQVAAHKVLTEGSSVPVRVTRALGGGRFEGFVAGVKVNFSSERALKPGDVFTATVSGNGSKIFLTPQKESGAVFQKIFTHFNGPTLRIGKRIACFRRNDQIQRSVLVHLSGR